MIRTVFTLTGLLLVLLITGIAAQAQRPPDRVMTLDQVLTGSEESNLRWPNAVAAASKDRIAVSDLSASRIFFFKRIGVSWALEQIVECPSPPIDLIWDRDRYVISTRRSGVLFVVAGPGSAIEELRIASGFRPGARVELLSGGQLVYDQGTSNIVRIARNGESLESASIDSFVTALAARPNGGWLAALPDKGEIAVFDAKGRPTDRWSLPPLGPVPAWPAGVATDREGRIFVADRHNGRILVLDSSGRWIGVGSRKGWDAGLLIRPAGIVRLAEAGLLVADQGNGRAQLFRLTIGASLQ